MLANDTYANWAGFERGEEIIGSNVEQWIHPNALPTNSQAVSKLLRDGVVDEYESLLIDRNGVQREIAVVAMVHRTPAGTRFTALMRDIHRRKNAERARLESESRFRDLINGSLEGIFIADQNMQTVFLNPMAAKMHGYEHLDEILAFDPDTSLTAPHELLRMKEWRRQILAGEDTEIEQEFERRCKDGSPIWVRFMSKRVIWDGQPMVLSTMLDVTERHRAREERAEFMARYQKLVEGSLEGIFVSGRDMLPLFVNPTAARIFGYNDTEDLLSIGCISKLLPPHELALMKEWRRQIFEGEAAFLEREYEGQRKDGSKIWVQTRGRLIEWDGQPALQATIIDITERRRAASAKAEADDRLRGIIENAPFSIVIKDLQGRYALMNQQAEDWLGKSFEDIAGKLPTDIHPLEHGEREREFDLAALRQGSSVSYEFTRERDGGRTFWATKFPILGKDGRPTGIGSIVSDITERKKSENILQRQMELAEESSDAKTRFLAAASHDLRQPLHSMELMLEIQARQLQGPGQQELVSDIAQAASIAGGLLNPLLDFSRLEAGMVEPKFHEFSIASLLRDIEVGFRPQAEQAGLRLVVVACNATIRSDKVLLSRIISNLMSNAIRYTETGRVLIGCRRQGEGLRIEVWDTGAGIEARHLNAIFEEFHQIDTVGRDRDKGLGLGLAIVNIQAALLGHEVRVSSQPGHGSCFVVEVPLCETEEVVVEPEVAASLALPEPLTGLRMLILEDNLAIRRATKTLLERWGCEVATAASRREAMDVIDRETAKFDLIIADYHLEDGDNGVDTVVNMQDVLEYDVPAIIVTADISNESLEHTSENAFPLLQKPFRPAALRSAIAQSIQAHAQ